MPFFICLLVSSGHSDVVMGLVSVNDDNLHERLRFLQYCEYSERCDECRFLIPAYLNSELHFCGSHLFYTRLSDLLNCIFVVLHSAFVLRMFICLIVKKPPTKIDFVQPFLPPHFPWEQRDSF